MTNAQSPEYQAVGAVASQLGKVLAKSGCTGDRIARAPAEPSDQTSAAPEGGDPEPGSEAETLARAEALNDEGKRLFLSADMNGALGKFQEAAQLVPDPRFELNICLAYEALKRYDDAIATCEKVAAQTANPRVAAKAKERVAINQHLRQ
jgi:tetratricopeptide (TPR) repeat protein